MKASLQLRLSQHLALTPQLQQSIRLLQLSTLELQQEVAMAISQNPLLENEDDWIASPLRVAADGSLIAQSPNSSAPPDQMGGNTSSSTSSSERAENGEPQGVDEYNGLASDNNGDASQWDLGDYGRSGNASDDDDLPPLQIHESSTSLRDHLMAQLRVTQASQRDRALITFLIESLDDDGYLAATLDEVLADLPEELEVDLDEMNAALALLHSFDPAGVGARSASECLKLQLLRLEQSPTRTLALDIVAHHLELLAARDFTRLRKHLKANDDDLRDAHILIRSLEPFPGAAYGKAEADYVVPDIMVRKTAQGWQAELNPEVVPKLRINHLYANILRNNRGDPGSGSLRQQLQEARWLIKNIQQRFETILRVAQAIVERQKSFFVHGEIAMRPLVLREIADTLGLHESTVSRVTTGKYMLTPFGTLEFKYFFGSHVSTDTGGAASSTAIRALIKQLIGAENPKSPLSDSRIAELLAEQGFVVARRTVAKYREALKIPAVNLRKSL
ncbi:RNA polymerase sigma-54 factor [Paraburkholderia domus]|jgi:RNA polymerase sigma-54 factor|uniref:RNA polymerase sigma-54 factor n=1 Tax=Paraburkholderia domus TaxID=2793075 RepID=A0A9N8MJZ2_9BURK|nr:RNA polymerase factor sigma-54 [Paraburkholderia domus]MBK5048068.1 RNA polymerase factor sigma-54 [Burkholderia sp. R-70006]MBK5063120.1 RNA polymerase factor sigma-54 [Burkholderia sp. R-70199]MBK5084428.1 RNA polymerase factor sigma-54 [Burkholderia sp. R-69927]MBK5122981.1 RNA polymerase factor sigma-54 [Burkholderia sp. R-69980]MBK5163469.1 RNA polymerase factor sigma-54 [Burkholderia sp. R-70211]MCI0149526.1 RNA polymerase factor sigma-54 [Paraburkholderia sediminicola]